MPEIRFARLSLTVPFVAALALPAGAQGLPATELPAPASPPAEALAEQLEDPQVMHGERLDPETAYGRGYVESMDTVMERERLNPSPTKNHKLRDGAQGSWAVPSRRSSFHAHSGEHYVMNKWGDTRMRIEFGESVDFDGAWISGHAADTLWADGLRIHGYRGDELQSSSDWLEELSDDGEWVSANFEGVTSIEIEARPVYQGGGWFGLDDLTFTRPSVVEGEPATQVVIDFDDLSFNTKVTGSGYGGLTWPMGSGSFEMPVQEVHAPKVPAETNVDEIDESLLTQNSFFGGSGTAPVLTMDIVGPRLGDAGAGWLPPDTNGAIGPNHFVAAVNQNLSVYDRNTGARLVNTGIANFFNTGSSAGDPRLLFDPHSNRFILLAEDFSSKIFLAVSMTDDPTGSWFKTSVVLSQGSDSNFWPDYPTLGVDATGIYTACYMVGGGMSLFAIDKAPLVAATPSLGTVTAFRGLPWEGAIQPCLTYGTPGRMYCVSRRSGGTLRLRYVLGPMNNPTLVEAGNVSVPGHGSPPNVPAQGSVAPLDALDFRPMNAVYRNGSVWTTHGVASGGRAACRWYEIDPIAVSTVQVGTVNDPVLGYMMPSISVNANDEVVLGFSGSSANQFAGAYFAGRVPTDPAGQLSAPVLLKAGANSYNTVDASGVNRWGDYSLTTIDPLDDLTVWTIQEYARNAADTWGTRIGRLEFPFTCPAPSNYCLTSANSVGSGALISATGVPSFTSNNFELSAVGLPANKPGLFFYGQNTTVSVLGDGLLCLAGSITRLGVTSSGAFGLAIQLQDLNSAPYSGGSGLTQAGDTRHFQYWYRDPSFGSSGFNLTDGLTVTFCP